MVEKEVNYWFFLLFYFFLAAQTALTIHVCFLDTRACLSQRMVEAKEYQSIDTEQYHVRKKWSIQGIKAFSASMMLWIEGVSRLASYLWVRSKELGSIIWEAHTTAACWRDRDLLSLMQPIWHLPQAPNSLIEHKKVNKPCVFNTSQNFIFKGTEEKKDRKEGISLTVYATDCALFFLVRVNFMRWYHYLHALQIGNGRC